MHERTVVIACRQDRYAKMRALNREQRGSSAAVKIT